jgi:hypothetical protein
MIIRKENISLFKEVSLLFLTKPHSQNKNSILVEANVNVSLDPQGNVRVSLGIRRTQFWNNTVLEPLL